MYIISKHDIDIEQMKFILKLIRSPNTLHREC